MRHLLPAFAAIALLGGMANAAPPVLIAQATPDVETALLELTQPETAPTDLGTMFGANAYTQVMLNFQMGGTPEATAGFYQESLPEAGYTEREINTAVEQWGFNLVFDLPETVTLEATDPAKTVVLVLQGTQLSPEMINVNIRFEEI